MCETDNCVWTLFEPLFIIDDHQIENLLNCDLDSDISDSETINSDYVVKKRKRFHMCPSTNDNKHISVCSECIAVECKGTNHI